MRNLSTTNIILITLICGVVWYLFNIFTYKYINIEFSEMRPLHEKVFIFYKGIKVGHVRHFKIADHHQTTIARSVLTYKNLMLPINTTAKLKKEKKHKKEYDFIELIYPEKPSNILISNGAYIDGKATVDVDTYFANQDADDLEIIKRNLTQSSEELQVVLSSLGGLFATLEETVKGSQQNITKSTYNLAQTTRNINNLSEKFNSALKQDQLNKSVSDVTNSLKNLSETTSSFQQFGNDIVATTGGLNSSTMPQLNSTLYRTECLIANVNDITCGVKQTLQKRFGGFRLLFGQVIQKK